MLNVWYESLGHTQLKKFTAQLKEDKKKVDKRERREKEEEEEKLRPYIGFVKYTLGLKHQVISITWNNPNKATATLLDIW